MKTDEALKALRQFWSDVHTATALGARISEQMLDRGHEAIEAIETSLTDVSYKAWGEGFDLGQWYGAEPHVGEPCPERPVNPYPQSKS